MAVARDTFDSFRASSNGATSLTYSYTCSGSNRYLVVFVNDFSGDTVTGVTYAGVSMTQLVKETRNPNTGSYEIYAYGLAAPATGANNVVISRSGTTANIEARTISYTGVNQVTSPIDATAHSNGTGSTSTTITTSITTIADNTAVCGLSVQDNASIAHPITAGTNWTLLATGGASNGGAHALFESATFPKTPAGATSYTANSPGASAGDIAQIIVSLAPAVAASGNSNFFTFF